MLNKPLEVKFLLKVHGNAFCTAMSGRYPSTKSCKTVFIDEKKKTRGKNTPYTDTAFSGGEESLRRVPRRLSDRGRPGLISGKLSESLEQFSQTGFSGKFSEKLTISQVRGCNICRQEITNNSLPNMLYYIFFRPSQFLIIAAGSDRSVFK